MNHRLQILLETVRRLLRRGATHNLSNVMEKTHPADIAHLFRYLEEKEKLLLFHLIDDKEKAATVLSDLDPASSAQLLDQLEQDKIIEVLRELPNDDALEIIRSLPDEVKDEVLETLQQEEGVEYSELLQYDEDSAGGIMSTDVFSLEDTLTVREAIDSLQHAEDIDMVFYLYVTDANSSLVGVLSLRQLLTVPPESLLREVMTSTVISVRTDIDQEEVARVVEKYDFLAIPVVDDTNKLMGIITVDDIIDVLRQEATEDIYMMAGASEEELSYGNRAFHIARLRLPWLITNLFGGVITGYIMWVFKVTIKEVIALLSFVPVITGMGGNVGGQSATIVVRGFATGKIDLSNIRAVFFKELRVGMIMGCVCGMVIGLVAYGWHHNPYLGIVVGVAMMTAITVAATMGVIVTSFFEKIGIDPAIASSPFVQTANDITGILIYLATATAFLNYLR